MPSEHGRLSNFTYWTSYRISNRQVPAEQVLLVTYLLNMFQLNEILIFRISNWSISTSGCHYTTWRWISMFFSHLSTLSIYSPTKQVDVEKDVFSIVEVEFVSFDHDFSHRVCRGT